MKWIDIYFNINTDKEYNIVRNLVPLEHTGCGVKWMSKACWSIDKGYCLDRVIEDDDQWSSHHKYMKKE